MNNEELVLILENRFINNQSIHKNINWNDILKRLTDEVLSSLKYMEEKGGECEKVLFITFHKLS